MCCFSERLKEARENVGLTQKSIAELIGIGKPSYQKYEYNEREPDFDTLKKLCSVLHVSSDYLLGLSSNPAPATPLSTAFNNTESFVISQNTQRIESIKLNTGAILYISDMPYDMQQALKPWLEAQYYKYLALNPEQPTEEADAQKPDVSI